MYSTKTLMWDNWEHHTLGRTVDLTLSLVPLIDFIRVDGGHLTWGCQSWQYKDDRYTAVVSLNVNWPAPGTGVEPCFIRADITVTDKTLFEGKLDYTLPRGAVYRITTNPAFGGWATASRVVLTKYGSPLPEPCLEGVVGQLVSDYPVGIVRGGQMTITAVDL